MQLSITYTVYDPFEGSYTRHQWGGEVEEDGFSTVFLNHPTFLGTNKTVPKKVFKHVASRIAGCDMLLKRTRNGALMARRAPHSGEVPDELRKELESL